MALLLVNLDVMGSGNDEDQVLRMPLDEDMIAFDRAIATTQNISASEVVAINIVDLSRADTQSLTVSLLGWF